jgi:hypothetical protein
MHEQKPCAKMSTAASCKILDQDENIVMFKYKNNKLTTSLINSNYH